MNINDFQAVLRVKKEQEKTEKVEEITVDPAGDINGNLVIEPLGYGYYLYKLGNNKGVVLAQQEEREEQKGKRTIVIKGKWYTKIENKTVYFTKPPFTNKLMPFRVPSNDKILKYIKGEYTPKDTKELYRRILSYFQLIYDLEDKAAYSINALNVFTSYLAPILNSINYAGFDAKPQSGKTNFLEGMIGLCYHGYMTGDLTPAVVGRMTDKYKLSLGIDEVDECPALFPLLRKGYKKNNPYIRLKDKTYEEEIFNVYGFKAYTYAGDIEAALKTRSTTSFMSPSTDNTLPILSKYKEQIGDPLQDELFFWYIDNISGFVAHVSAVALVAPLFDQKYDFEQIRKERKKAVEKIYSDLGFSTAEKKVLEKLFARNLELAFSCLQIVKLLGLEIHEDIRTSFLKKQESENSYDDNYYYEILVELLTELYENRENDDYFFKGSKDRIEGIYYTAKTRVYVAFRNKCEDLKVQPVGTPKFNEYLKELGFVKEVNMSKQRCGNKTVLALIFDKKIQEIMSSTEVEVVEEVIQ